MKKILALLLALVMVLSLAACGAKEEPKAEAPAAAETEAAAPAAETVKVALVIVAGDHGFTGESVKHAELEAAAMNAKYDNVEVVVKSCGEAADQISEIENLIATDKPDAIMLWPTEGEALRAAAQTVIDAGIDLVVYDRLIEDFDGLTGQMMGDNFAIGGGMGEYLNTYYADYEAVDYLRFVGDASTVTSQRSGGMDEVLTEGKFNQVAETFVTNWSSETAQNQMEDWLAAKTKEKCWKGTKALLQLLMEAGYRVSKKKAQICKEEVRYLGFVLKKDTRFQTLVGSYILMALAL